MEATGSTPVTWVKLDDAFWRHRKIRKAWREPRAVGLYVMALARCNEEESDGFVDPEWLEMQIADPDELSRVVGALVSARLWEPFGDGWHVHGYDKYQPTSAKLAEVREARRMAGALGGKASGNVRRLNRQRKQ